MASKPLVKGGHYHGNEPVMSSFISNTPPTIFDNTRIVAAASPNIRTGHPTEDGWFLSDFYAFNYLYKGLGASQVWLTAADPYKLLSADKDHGAYLHGNPYQDRKVVLSRELLDNKELTPVTVVKMSSMISRFLDEVERASKIAMQENGHLLLLVFCHGIGNHQLILDNGSQEKGLSITRLKGVLHPGARVTLLTTACFSGGWIVSPELNHTAMTAAGVKTESNAWLNSPSLRRACGSIFASTLVKTLTSVTSELLDAEQGPSLPQAGMAKEELISLQPDDANEQQTKTYNEFCRSVWEVCEDRVRRFWDRQEFSFCAQNDEWEHSWMGRTGIPLAHFEQRWNNLATCPYQGPADRKANMDPSPSNPTFRAESQLEERSRTGGIGESTEAMISGLRQRRTTELARLWLDTRPGDWSSGQNVALRGFLTDHAKGNAARWKDHPKGWEIMAVIRYQWELALLADHIVNIFRLPIPLGQSCLMWDRDAWMAKMQKTMPDWKERSDPVVGKLFDHAGFIYGTRSQGPPFYRFAFYIAASFALAEKSQEESTTLVEEILELIDTAQRFYQQRACQDSRVRDQARVWFNSIGRSIRRSLSPSKHSEKRPTVISLLDDGGSTQARGEP